MTDHEALLSRRELLAVGVGTFALVSGCTTRPSKPRPDPDAAAIDAARRAERVLLAAYAEGSDGHAIHLAHLRALGDRMPPPSPAPTAPTVRSGRPPEGPTVQPLVDAARNATRGATAAVLASIAASHAVLSGVSVP